MANIPKKLTIVGVALMIRLTDCAFFHFAIININNESMHYD